MKWSDLIQAIENQYGVHYSDEQVGVLTFEKRSNWLRHNPVTAARHFQYRLNTFFHDFLKSGSHPLGKIADYGLRIEFQGRASRHAHCVIWVEDAPKFQIDSDKEVCTLCIMCYPYPRRQIKRSCPTLTATQALLLLQKTKLLQV